VIQNLHQTTETYDARVTVYVYFDWLIALLRWVFFKTKLTLLHCPSLPQASPKPHINSHNFFEFNTFPDEVVWRGRMDSMNQCSIPKLFASSKY